MSPRSTCTWGGKLCNWICPGCLTASSFGCPETPFALGLSNDPAVFDQAGLGPLPDGESDSTTGTLSSCAPMPGPVSNVSLLMLHGADLILLTWDDATNADDYVVFSDTAPNGVFSGAVGVATSGSSGLTVSVPQEDEFYLVGDRNVTCGIGPRH